MISCCSILPAALYFFADVRSADDIIAFKGHPGVMNNDLAYTMIAGMNAAAGNGDAAHNNLTAFLNTDKARMHADGKRVEYGCSRPCLHDSMDNRSFCAPCVGFNTMVEEGSNPILEGSIAIASNVLDMLMQDYFFPPPVPRPTAAGAGVEAGQVRGSAGGSAAHAGQHGSSSANEGEGTGNVLLAVFAAVPSTWTEAVFHNLRAAGAFLVSGQLSRSKVAWVQIASEAGLPVELAADFGTESVFVRSSKGGGGGGGGGGTVTLQSSGKNRWKLIGLEAGQTALVTRNRSVGGGDDGFKVSVSPVAPNKEELNYYGFRRDEW